MRHLCIAKILEMLTELDVGKDSGFVIGLICIILYRPYRIRYVREGEACFGQ